MCRLLGIWPILILVIMTTLACNARSASTVAPTPNIPATGTDRTQHYIPSKPTVAPTPNIPATVQSTIRQELKMHSTARDVYQRVSGSVARICLINGHCFQTGFSVNTKGGILTAAHGIVNNGATASDLYVRITRLGAISEVGVKSLVFAEAGDAAYIVTEPAHDMPPIPVVDSRDVFVGDTVTMVGYPDSLYQTRHSSVTQGIIVTASVPYTDKAGHTTHGVVTDIAGASGYSGSPILQGGGCVIAINKSRFNANPLFAYGLIIDRMMFLSNEYYVLPC